MALFKMFDRFKQAEMDAISRVFVANLKTVSNDCIDVNLLSSFRICIRCNTCYCFLLFNLFHL